MSRTWIESESGNLIASDAVREFGIIGPIDPPAGWYMGSGYWDFYAFGVGEVILRHDKAYRDQHRYLLQHRSYDACFHVFEELKRAIRKGKPYFSVCETLRMAATVNHATGIKLDGEGEPWRSWRLNNAVRFAQACRGFSELGAWIDRVSDHEGTMTIFWKRRPHPGIVKVMIAAWEHVNETEVQHFFEDREISETELVAAANDF
jgi:hypothetical protein